MSVVFVFRNGYSLFFVPSGCNGICGWLAGQMGIHIGHNMRFIRDDGDASTHRTMSHTTHKQSLPLVRALQAHFSPCLPRPEGCQHMLPPPPTIVHAAKADETAATAAAMPAVCH